MIFGLFFMFFGGLVMLGLLLFILSLLLRLIFRKNKFLKIFSNFMITVSIGIPAVLMFLMYAATVFGKLETSGDYYAFKNGEQTHHLELNWTGSYSFTSANCSNLVIEGTWSIENGDLFTYIQLNPDNGPSIQAPINNGAIEIKNFYTYQGCTFPKTTLLKESIED